MTISHSCKQTHLLGGHCRSEVRLYVRLDSPVEHPKLRNDAGGKGHFGASRSGGTRAHKGIDIATTVDQKVFSPISGKITKIGWANATHRYVEVSGVTVLKDMNGKMYPGEDCTVRVMYIKPSVEKDKLIEKGALIGKADDLHRNKQYPKTVGQHVHVEIKVGDANINPDHIVAANGP